jgi:hypothetical protein
MVSGTAGLGAVLWVGSQGAPGGMDGSCNPGVGRLPAAVRATTSAGDVFGRGASPTSLALVDVTGRRDGHMDLLLLLRNGSAAVAWNNGSDFFPDPVTVLAGSGCTVLATADVNADLVPDVLTGGSVACSAAWAGNPVGATGSFTRLLELSTALVQLGPVSSLVTADLDCNGNLDVLAATGAGVFAVLLARGGGVLGVRPVFNESWAGRSGPVTALALGDVTGDGVVDVVGCCGGSASSVGGVVVLAGDCATGVHTPTWLSAPLGPCASLALGDMAADGGLDIVVSGATAGAPVQVLVNQGHGSSGPVFVAGRVVGAGPAAAALVDVDDDGLLDVPGAGHLAAHGDLASMGLPLYVRPLGRDAGWNQHGATVCVVHAESGARAGCRVVDGGGSGGSQGPYDTHFRIPIPAAATSSAYNVTVGFVSGHRHSALTTRACSVVVAAPSSPAGVVGAVAVVRDVPAVAAVSFFPTAGPLGIGSVLTVTITALWGEANLEPAPPPACCVVNGADVSHTFFRGGNGTYRLNYVVREGDPEVWLAPPTFVLALRDPRFPDAVSDGAQMLHLAAPYAGLSVDAQAPQVTFTCGPVNGTTRPTDNDTVCVSCGVATHEATLGCVVRFRRLSPLVDDGAGGTLCNATAGSSVNHTAAFVHRHEDAPAVQFWAVDAAGNQGPPVVLHWVVDSLLPITGWPALSASAALTKRVEMELALTCNRRGCRFWYVLDGGPETAVGETAADNSTAAAVTPGAPVAYGNGVDTVLRLGCAKVTSARACAVAVSVVVNGSVVPPGSPLVWTQVRVDGAAAWSNVTQLPGFDAQSRQLHLTNLAESAHRVEARAVHATAGADATPTEALWVVAPTPPVARVLRGPGTWDASLRSRCVQFVVAAAGAAPPAAVAIEYQVWVNDTGGWRPVNVSAPVVPAASAGVLVGSWVRAPVGALVVCGLTPGAAHHLALRGLDTVAGAGPVTTCEWRAGACAGPEDAELGALGVTPVASGVVVVSWTALGAAAVTGVQGYVWALDDGPWVPVAASSAVVSGVSPRGWHRVRVRAALTPECGGDAASGALPAALASWYEPGPPPGDVTFVAAPPAVARSVFAAVVVNSTAAPWLVAFQCALDGGGWVGCGHRGTIHLGPLVAGTHSLAVRAVSVLDGAVGAAAAAHWQVAPAAAATVVVETGRDGAAALTVAAVAGSVGEARPRALRWGLDTVPPGTQALRLSPPLTNLTRGDVQAWCSGEAIPTQCRFGWQAMLAGATFGSGVAAAVAGGNATITAVVPAGDTAVAADGEVLVRLTAVDGVGNVGRRASVRWVQDTTPPTTAATVASPVTWAPALAHNAVLTPYLLLALGCNEAASAYVVRAAAVSQPWWQTPGGSPPGGTGTLELTMAPPTGGLANLTLPFEGVVALAVTAVDLAGNAALDAVRVPVALLPRPATGVWGGGGAGGEEGGGVSVSQ